MGGRADRRWPIKKPPRGGLKPDRSGAAAAAQVSLGLGELKITETRGISMPVIAMV